MAKTSTINIVWEDEKDLRNYMECVVNTSETLARGDLVEISAYGTNTCGPVDGAAAELFMGVSTGYYVATETATICLNCIITCAISTNAFAHAGIGAKRSAGDNGTAWVLDTCTENSLDIIAYSMEVIAASGTGRFWVCTNTMKNFTTGSNMASTDPEGLFRSPTSD